MSVLAKTWKMKLYTDWLSEQLTSNCRPTTALLRRGLRDGTIPIELRRAIYGVLTTRRRCQGRTLQEQRAYLRRTFR